MELTPKMKIQLIFFPFTLSGAEHAVCVRIYEIEQESNINLDELIRWKNTFMWYERHHLLVANWHTHAVVNNF